MRIGTLAAAIALVATVCESTVGAVPIAPMNCSASPFSADATGYRFIPFVTSSRRFPFANNDFDFPYANNVDYEWQMWFSGNVTSAGWVFKQGTFATPGFQTEYQFDWFCFGPICLTGNADNNHTVEYSTSQSRR
jgi:hypothetical protein